MEIKFNPKKLLVVDIDKVRPNTWNPKEKNTKEYETVKKSLELKGFRMPIAVRENNGYEIVDGEQRWTAWKELGNKVIPIYNEGKMTDQEAMELTIWYEQKVPFDEIDLAQLVTEMNEQYENLQLPFSDQEIEDMIKMADFDWENYQKDFEPEEIDFKSLVIQCSKEQYDIIMSAMDKVKLKTGDEETSEARALELICADYLASS